MYRYRERISWPLLRQSAAGLISQLAEIGGFDSLEAPRRLEAAPYVVTKNVSHVRGEEPQTRGLVHLEFCVVVR